MCIAGYVWFRVGVGVINMSVQHCVRVHVHYLF